MKRNAKILVGTVVLVAAGVVFGLKVYRDKLTVSLPDYSPIGKTAWLDQNWEPKKRDWYHHADQGTLTFGIPYEWFMALEQPALSFTAVGLLSDANYLDRYGFIPGSTENSKHELPVGFARGAPMKKADGIKSITVSFPTKWATVEFARNVFPVSSLSNKFCG